MTDRERNQTLTAAREIDTGRRDQEADVGAQEGGDRDQPSWRQTARKAGPAALIGGGLLWLLANAQRRRQKPLRESTRELKENLREHVDRGREVAGERLEATRERLEETRETALEKLEHGRERALSSGRRLRTSALQHPVVLASCSMAAGFALGLLLPPTRQEDNWLGATSDRLLEQARDIVDEARRVATRSLEAARDTAAQELEQAKEQLKEAAEKTLETAQETAVKEFEEALPESQPEPTEAEKS